MSGPATQTVPTPVLGRQHLVQSLVAAGVPRGGGLLVNCSLGQLGRIEGGAPTLLAALREASGPDATIVVPTQTPNNSVSSRAFIEATRGLSHREVVAYQAAMPGFDRERTPSFGMGALAEVVRTQPDAVRSSHPQTSFAAVGPAADEIMAIHDLDCHLGHRSPLGRLYALRAYQLLLGVGFDRCTALHLAEYQLPQARLRPYRAFLAGPDGRREQCDFVGTDLDDSDFAQLGDHLSTLPFVRPGRVGRATTIVMPIRLAVDSSVRWMMGHRSER